MRGFQRHLGNFLHFYQSEESKNTKMGLGAGYKDHKDQD